MSKHADADEATTRVFEAALAAICLLLTGGVIYFLAGHLIGGAKRHVGKSQPPPAAGSVPNERHRNVTSVSVR
jgi:hypothetical protein